MQMQLTSDNMCSCRNVSRCLLIPFSLPEIGGHSEEDFSAWNNLEETWVSPSSCIGYVISLGDVLEREGFEEIQTTFTQMVQKILDGMLFQDMPCCCGLPPK